MKLNRFGLKDKLCKDDCCCNCKFFAPISKHPWNKSEVGKGSMSEFFGFVCTMFFMTMDNEERTFPVTYNDRYHGLCEMHTPHKKAEKKS